MDTDGEDDNFWMGVHIIIIIVAIICLTFLYWQYAGHAFKLALIQDGYRPEFHCFFPKGDL